MTRSMQRRNTVVNCRRMRTQPHPLPNPRRVAAGRRNRQLRGPLTPEGRERLRQSAIEHKPWRFSTGPRTAAGKARVANNGRYGQKTERSRRQMRAAVADVSTMIAQMAGYRTMLGSNGR